MSGALSFKARQIAARARFEEKKAFARLNHAVSGFRSKSSNEGYATPNRFEVTIYPPPGASSLLRAAGKVSLRCESVTIPGRNLNTLTDSNIYGPTR